jgi:hypothetical protein
MEPDPTSAHPAQPRRRWGAVPLVAVALLALAGGYLGGQLALRPVLAELPTRPPVLILDVAQAVRGLAPAQVDAAIAYQRAVARRLADGGVLVLDPQAVIEAPAGLFVRTAPDREGRP